MSDASPTTPRKRSTLLIVSLCLNVLLVPVIAVIIFHATHRSHEIGSGGVLAPHTVMRTIPSESDRIEAIVAAHTPKIRALRQAAAQARRAAFTALSAPDYSAEKFRASLDAVAAADSALEQENIAMMRESLATLSATERAAMVARTKSRIRWLSRWFSRPPRE